MWTATEIISDPAGFPMVWFEEIGAHVHWLPVTKIQFESFLCSAPDAYFDADWYDTVLALNPRVTPRDVSVDNYWRALLTAVRPSEAQRFAAWCGDGFRLPTDGEWTALYRGLRARPVCDLAASGLLEGCDARTRELLVRLDAASREVTRRANVSSNLAGQMLLRYGVMEWVRRGVLPAAWNARGEPLPEFCGTLELPDASPATLTAPLESSRFPAAGFRLLKFPSSMPDAKANGEPSWTGFSNEGE